MKVLEFEYYDWDDFEKYLDSLTDKDAAKLLATINNIETYGLTVAQRQKWVKKLESNLYEVRSKLASNIQRAIYFHWENNQYVITQGFTKKTKKTPKDELKKARVRRANYERSHSHEQD